MANLILIADLRTILGRQGRAPLTALALLLVASVAEAQPAAPVPPPPAGAAAPAAENPGAGAAAAPAPAADAPPAAEAPPPTTAPPPTPPAATTAPAVPAEGEATPAVTASAAPEANAQAEANAAADAEAAAIEADLGQGEEESAVKRDHALDIYGYADFAYGHAFHQGPGLTPWDSFSVGSFNVYLDAALGDKWHSLAEVRFMYLPHGVTSYDENFQASRTSTEVSDYLDLGRTTRWGGISIERAWVEYAIHPLVTVRAGQWLTPYGIWNVDHGSPVIIGVRRPFIVGDFLFPDRQTGLEVYGGLNLSATRIGYHLTLSNGRGPIDAYRDLNDNKAVGGRLFVTNESSAGTLTAGASIYRGKYTDRGQDYDAEFNAIYPRTAEYDELSLAADLKWELKGVLVQSEIISNEVAYADATRPQYFAMEGPPGSIPDNRRWGVYGLAGYRTPWIGIMPFFGGEYYRVGEHGFAPTAAAFWGGLNVRPTPRVVLKGQFTHAWFVEEVVGYEDRPSFQGLDFQIAWSF
ncbi:MAG: hypothetical protein JW751_14510 [Polyangiaceae bacterium]|nr:hypothetical protein [Polyangiaceae bacterium]